MPHLVYRYAATVPAYWALGALQARRRPGGGWSVTRDHDHIADIDNLAELELLSSDNPATPPLRSIP